MKLRGVNLGGWLIIERWMTPSLFGGTNARDEWTLMHSKGARTKLAAHRETFINEKDFKWLHENGINAVRIPVGYWVLDGDGPYMPAFKYLDSALRWAHRHKLHVLIDLHGAPGSQNGRDHSGREGTSDWYQSKHSRRQTIIVLEKIVKRYKDNPYFWGIELVNEPKYGFLGLKLIWFYRRAYRALRKVAPPHLHIVFHDAFLPYFLSGALGRFTHFQVVMDVHWYQFTDWFEKWRTLEAYFRLVGRRKKRLRRLAWAQPIIIGEWSVVLTGKILEGRDKKAEQEAFRRNGELQIKTYQEALGWFYWTYKTEGRGIWHFRSLVEDGIIKL